MIRTSILILATALLGSLAIGAILHWIGARHAGSHWLAELPVLVACVCVGRALPRRRA